MSQPLNSPTQTIPAGDSGLLQAASGYAPRPDETEPRIRRIQTKHVIVFWTGTAVGLSIAAYAYHAAKYKFESKKIAGYLKNGTDLAYSLGYLMEKAHQTKFSGAPEPPSLAAPAAPAPPFRAPAAVSDTSHIPPAAPSMPFPIRSAVPASGPPAFDIFQYGGNPDPSGIINAAV